MNFLLNLIWFIFGGFFAALGYVLGAIPLALSIVGIPFALQSLKHAAAMLWPFGRELRPNEFSNSSLALVFNIVWFLLFGWELALSHLLFGLLFSITIVGLPFGFQHFKLIPLALWPFGQSFETHA